MLMQLLSDKKAVNADATTNVVGYINWNIKIIFFIFCFNVIIGKTGGARINEPRCFTFVNIEMLI